VDYTTAPETMIGRKGIGIESIPSLGPSLDRVDPVAFEAGEEIRLYGDDLNGARLEVILGGVPLTITGRSPDMLVVTAEGSPGGPIAAGGAISAGEHPLLVRRRISATRTRSGNLVAARLLPTVSSANLVGGDLAMTGLLLGTDADDVVVALYQEGRTVRLFDVVTASANQQTLTVPGVAGAAPAGTYRAILRVNNQQAKSSPTVVLP
jgi:hypothetical protein